jgi:hypothetical protein
MKILGILTIIIGAVGISVSGKVCWASLPHCRLLPSFR